MGPSICIEIAALERRPLEFDTRIQPSLLELSHSWSVTRAVETTGVAELLDRHGVRPIRVRGRISAHLGHACDRCLVELQLDLDSRFDLFFYPMAMIEDGGEVAISLDETEVGFYEGEGLGLDQVVREQLLLWLPARSLCRKECRGLCPTCGRDLNQGSCDCQNSFVDPRWDALRSWARKP